MEEEEEGKSNFFWGTRDLQLNHEKHLSAGKYFIYKKDRRGYLLRVRTYAKYGVFYANIFKMTPLRLQRESLWLADGCKIVFFLIFFNKYNDRDMKRT